jgi:oxygen-independent coproporphyrinogen-3 oxidase
MNRRHNANQANEVLEMALNAGFRDISADLIYGLPGLTAEQWKSDLVNIFKTPITHLSAYHLTYHEGTPFHTWLKKRTLLQAVEEESIAQFRILCEQAEKNGFEHYEISNFALNGMYSKHNTSYWKGRNYLGLGPSAHSYNGISRSWNVAHTEKYISSVEAGKPAFEHEVLTENDRYNEYILTGIRTIWGVSEETVFQQFGAAKTMYFKQQINKYINLGLAVYQNGIFTLTREGWFISDEITANLMFI